LPKILARPQARTFDVLPVSIKYRQEDRVSGDDKKPAKYFPV